MADVVSLSMAKTQPALAELSAQVERTLEEHAVPPKANFSVQLAIDELLSNIVRYGCDRPGDGEVMVRLAFEEGAISIEIENEGDRFNPFERADPELDQPVEERPIGGLGIHLTRNVMDDFTYSYHDGHNLMVLRKKFALDG